MSWEEKEELVEGVIRREKEWELLDVYDKNNNNVDWSRIKIEIDNTENLLNNFVNSELHVFQGLYDGILLLNIYFDY
jgi:hypothetical protein